MHEPKHIINLYHSLVSVSYWTRDRGRARRCLRLWCRREGSSRQYRRFSFVVSIASGSRWSHRTCSDLRTSLPAYPASPMRTCYQAQGRSPDWNAFPYQFSNRPLILHLTQRRGRAIHKITCLSRNRSHRSPNLPYPPRSTGNRTFNNCVSHAL